MELARRWRALGTSAAASALSLGVVLIAAGSSATAAGTQSCGNHAVTIYVQGEANQPPQKLKGHTKNVKATNVSCKAAFRFLDALYKDATMGPPEHFKCKTGKGREPKGYFPQVCTRGAKKIEYGAQGG